MKHKHKANETKLLEALQAEVNRLTEENIKLALLLNDSDEENHKLKNDLDILDGVLKHCKVLLEKNRDLYLKECRKSVERECTYCAPDGTIWNGDSSKICPYCKGSHYINLESELTK